MNLSLLEFTFSTFTTFISDIRQTNGVISATKKKLPTFAGCDFFNKIKLNNDGKIG